MAYLGILLVLIVAYTIRYFDGKAEESQNKRIEELHSNAYKWIDENTTDLALARERKAEIDTMINNCVEHNGRKYKPSDLKQVTTKKEREARNEATIKGERYISSDMAYSVIASEVYTPTEEDVWEYTEHTTEEKREHYVDCLMKRLGISREEAEARADKFYAELREI